MFIFSCSHRLNLHSTLQFSSLTPCDSSPLHDSPRATSLTIRSSHLASEDPPHDQDPIPTSFRLPIIVLASFLKVSAARRSPVRIASRRRRILPRWRGGRTQSAYC